MSKGAIYPVQIFWSEEDDGYIAVAPDLPGCSAFGDTPEEALRESNDAIASWLQAAASAGNPIPEPSHPPLHRKHSGKVLVRMPQTLHGQLAREAQQEDVSLNQYIVYLLAAGTAWRQGFARFATRASNGVAGGLLSVSGIGGNWALPGLIGILDGTSPSPAAGTFRWGTLVGSCTAESATTATPPYLVSVNPDTIVQRATNG